MGSPNRDKLGDLIRDTKDASKACSLITSYMPSAIRQVAYFEKRYPYDDVEPYIMQALYLAAYTFNGKGSFYWWFKTKVLGQTSRFRRSAKIRVTGRLRSGRLKFGAVREVIPVLKRVSLTVKLIDRRLSYLDSTPE